MCEHSYPNKKCKWKCENYYVCHLDSFLYVYKDRSPTCNAI